MTTAGSILVPGAGVHGLPRPEPDPALWEAVLSAGFREFPERKKNWELYLRERFQSDEVRYLPVKMDIENVSRCNFRCTMCQVSDWAGGKRARDLTLQEFKDFLLQQVGITEIKLQGLGEPLLGPDFFEMIRFARSRHIWVRVTTNSSLLHHKENYRHLVDSDVCEVQMSLDGATPEVFEAIRRGGRFSQVTQNMRLFNEYASSQSRLRSKMWVVVQEKNFDQLEKFPALAAELGFRRLVFSLELTDWGQKKWQETNRRVYRADQFTSERGQRLVKLGEEAGVDVRFWYIDEQYDLKVREKLCPWPWNRAYVSSDMRVVPCCKVGNPQVYDLGPAENFEETWNSDKYRAFRRMHMQGKLPFICKSCYGSS